MKLATAINKATGRAASADDSGPERVLDVVVVFTTVKHTLEALRTAASMARGLNAGIRVVVPQIVPYPLPLERPPVDRDFTERKFQTLIPSGPIPTRVDVRLCRDEAAILDGIGPNSLIVIGVRSRWWPRGDRRLARLLRAEGHHVVTIERKRASHA